MLCCPFLLEFFSAPGLHGKAMRDFQRDYGIKHAALDSGVLMELSKEEGEAELVQSGALIGLSLARNDAMIVNVARYIRREILRTAEDARLVRKRE